MIVDFIFSLAFLEIITYVLVRFTLLFRKISFAEIYSVSCFEVVDMDAADIS